MKFYRIFLPKKFNDGTPVPQEKITEILEKIQARYGGYSYDPAKMLPFIQGSWADSDGKNYQEPMHYIELCIEDTSDNVKWLRAYKELIRQELKQREIFIIEQYAEVL